MTHKQITFKSKRAQLRIERILEVLQAGPLSSADLALAVHCDRSAIYDYLAHLMAEPRRVRIFDHPAATDAKIAARVPRYALGSEPDAELVPLTPADYRASVKNDPQRLARRQQTDRDRMRRKRAAVPIEERVRDRRVYDPPLEEQIHALLNTSPGYDRPKITARLGANERAVQRALRALVASGRVRRAEHGTGKTWKWETPENPVPAPLAAGLPKMSWMNALLAQSFAVPSAPEQCHV